MTAPTIEIIQWLLDTRPLWPVNSTAKPKEQMQQFTFLASKALSLLPTLDQEVVLRYHYVRDAKMSLISHLLKRVAIVKLLGVPWKAAAVGRDGNGKPVYVANPVNGSKKVEFNVSHQAGLVTLVACVYSEGEAQPDLGTDVVCVNERDDYGRIEKEGFFNFIDMYSDVFSPLETQALKMDTTQLGLPENLHLSLTGYGRDAIARCQYCSQRVTWKDTAGEAKEIDAKVIVEAKLRRFYALWCLREAYVKMTGEALLAEWLQELEFRTFKTPSPAPEASDTSSTGLELGEIVKGFEIYFKGKRVKDVAMELRALGTDYMVASAVRVRAGDLPGVEFNGFVELKLERDVYAIAEAD